MTTSPGLASLTRRRFATPRSAAAVIVILTALAAFLIAAAPRMLAEVLHREIAYQVGQLSDVQRDLTSNVKDVTATFGEAQDASLTMGWSPGSAALFGAVAHGLAQARSDAAPAVQAITAPAEFVVFQDPLTIVDPDAAADDPTQLVQLLADPLVSQELALVEGRMPSAWQHSPQLQAFVDSLWATNGEPTPQPATPEVPMELVMTAEVAHDAAWSIGQQRSFVVTMRDRANQEVGLTYAFELVGIVAPVDAADTRWQHSPSSALDGYYFDDGDTRPTMTSGAWVDPGSWANIRGVTGLVSGNDRTVFGRSMISSELAAWYPLAAQATLSQNPQELLAGLRQFTGQAYELATAEGVGSDVRARFDTQVTSVLDMSIRRGDATTMTLAVAAIGPIAVSLALIVLAARLIIRRRRSDLLLLSARGTSLLRLRRLLFGEGLALGVLPAALTTAAAIALNPRSAGLVPTIIALAVGLVPALALAFALRPATLEPGRADLDSPVTGRWSKLAELLVLLIAALAVGLLLFRGVGRGTSGVDPLVIAAPLLATVALGLMAVRLHPLWLKGVLRRAQRGTQVVPLIGAARSLRDPAAGTTAVLAMLVAVAIAVFSSLVLATVDRGAVTAAESQVGGDLGLTGPVFDAESIDRIEALDGVAAATGLSVAGREVVQAGSERIPATVYVTDTAELAAVQRGFANAFPVGLITPGQEPPQLVASTDVAQALGSGTQAELFGGSRVVGELTALPGNTAGGSFIVIDTADFAATTERGFFPRQVVIRLDAGADAAAVASDIRAVVPGAYVVHSLEARTKAIQSSPAVSALRIALLGAIVLAVSLSVVAIMLVAGVSRDARSRVVALLRTMGLGKQAGRRVISWEFVPLGVSALVGGLVLGAVLPLMLLRSIDLRPFTGGASQPALTVEPGLTVGLIGAVIVALVIAVFGGVMTARTTSLVTVLRTEEDQ